uniref:DNA-directed RNA polymerase III subunit RPC6 n=1 Tax=Haemonchus contortus TaxID=6289 RepID=A0A7I4XZH5_HAECO|nr:RNA polymerase Rpc34 domain containing protein [Haemonchus contortus]
MLASVPTVKTEIGAVENDAVEEQIYKIVQTAADGMDTDTISTLTAAIPALDRQNAINNLLVSKKLIIAKTSGGALRLKVNTNTQLSGASEEEQAIYTLIEDSKRKGIWIRELRDGSGLSQIQLRKVLKSLEQKKLIKNIKAVGTTKKCYMLYDLEPDTSLTGGTFYSDQQLDAELIHTLVNVCIGYIHSRRKQAIDNHPDDFSMQKELSCVRPQEIADFILEKRVLNVTITVDDVERILEVAILDGAIERRPDGKVRATSSTTLPSPLVTVPCSTCPVVDDCSSGHVISPQTCRYMAEWLSGN